MTLVWDDRLMTRGEALAHAGTWPVKPAQRQELWFLDCGRCGQAVIVCGAAASPLAITTEHIVTGVLRHMVTAHGHVTNRRNHGRLNAGSGPQAGDPGRGDGSAVAAAAGDRYADQAAGPGGSSSAAEGDSRWQGKTSGQKAPPRRC